MNVETPKPEQKPEPAELETLIESSQSDLRGEALREILKAHTRVERHIALYGPRDVCEECSEDRMSHWWPCETVEAMYRALAD